MSTSEPFGGSLRLSERHALVCGASAGIGRATAVALASLGARVTLLARRQDVLEQAVRAVGAAGAADARPLVADLDKHDDFIASIRALLAQHGPVHVLVNNSGGPAPGAILGSDARAFQAGFTRVLYASQALVDLCLPGMRQAA